MKPPKESERDLLKNKVLERDELESESLLTKEQLVVSGMVDLCFNVSNQHTAFFRYPDLRSIEIKRAYLSFLAKLENNKPEQLRHKKGVLEPMAPQLSTSSALNVDNVMLCRGITDAISLCVQTFCKGRFDKIVIHEPSFSYYEQVASVKNLGLYKIPLTGPELNQLHVGKKDWEQINSSQLVFICRPNNPTGSNIPLEQIKNLAAHTNTIIAIDEAYIEFSGEESCLTLLKEYPNLLILRTFSKAWGLAGLRAGVVLASAPNIAKLAENMGPFATPTPVQTELLIHLKENNYLWEHLEFIKNEREELLYTIATLPHVNKYYNSQANFITVQVSKTKELYDSFFKNNMLVEKTKINSVPALRITLGNSRENHKISQILIDFDRASSNFPKSPLSKRPFLRLASQWSKKIFQRELN